MLEPNIKNRLCIVSFYVTNLHHNLIVRLLDNKFGIQARGGCSCAGTYGHILLNVDKQQSQQIVNEVNNGNLSRKPGWVRISLHQLIQMLRRALLLAVLNALLKMQMNGKTNIDLMSV
ncbi:hypothetical protein [Psychrosphaera haliotis]|uniref:hypothetical protein n=1 Tax=Psychrosphaera haliotis TaxID=555083 RepID=UPI0039BFD497